MTACVNASNFSSELPFFRVNLGRWIGRIAALVRELGPYAAIELVLPAGRFGYRALNVAVPAV
jgi:hypothetical protein